MTPRANPAASRPQPRASEPAPSRGLHRLARLAALGTLLVLIAGASVTSTGSGLSVPDWPLSYGKLMPPMVGGIFFEHGHRMIAGTVGLLLLALAVWTWRREPRGRVRAMATAALVLVAAQAGLGGLTVLLLLPPEISVSHAALAMILFALVVALAVVTSSAWHGAERSAPRGRALGVAAVAVAGLVFLQIGIGAVMRHTGAGLACPDFPKCHGEWIPPMASSFLAVHFAHRIGGVAVALAVWGLGLLALRWAPIGSPVRRIAGLAAVLVALQFGLGVASILLRLAPWVTVAHHAGGALLFAGTVAIALWSYRIAEPRVRPAPVPAARLAGEVAR